MHYKRALSIGQAVVGTMHAGRLSSAAVGRALARVFDITPKSGIKQVDRLLGNEQFDVAAIFQQSVPWLVAHRAEIVVSLDWTEYGAHGHSRIAVNLVTTHGRATPLVWKTVETKRLKRRRNRVEDEVLRLLASVLPQGVQVILLADRGFGDVKLYAYLEELGWDFVIRFRAGIRVENAAGQVRTAGAWIPARGQARELPDARVTAQRYPVTVVCVKQRAMKEAWCLWRPRSAATRTAWWSSTGDASRAKSTSATRRTPATVWASAKQRRARPRGAIASSSSRCSRPSCSRCSAELASKSDATAS